MLTKFRLVSLVKKQLFADFLNNNVPRINRTCGTHQCTHDCVGYENIALRLGKLQCTMHTFARQQLHSMIHQPDKCHNYKQSAPKHTDTPTKHTEDINVVNTTQLLANPQHLLFVSHQCPNWKCFEINKLLYGSTPVVWQDHQSLSLCERCDWFVATVSRSSSLHGRTVCRRIPATRISFWHRHNSLSQTKRKNGTNRSLNQ